ncbi:MAG: twin-arginine translocation signal domain-containing protein, partial [Immundisolibacteraceae bacterium]|nr:twin-arginine translocation signal domain-containing protein [Immundisolibacteraceae bacterium]
MGTIDSKLQPTAAPSVAISRRNFLKGSGGGALSLSMSQLGGAVSAGFVGQV